MVLYSRREYLKAIRPRYRHADKSSKALILDEFCATCGYNRKYAIRLLRKTSGDGTKEPKRSGPKSVYGDDETVLALKRLWLAMDQMCSKKLKAALPLWLPFYAEQFGPLDPTVQHKLLRISSSTIDRLLRPVKITSNKGRCLTKPGTLLKNQIPIKTDHWDVSRPGFFEADTVAHCGDSMAGDFINSLTFTDIHTTWTENRAIWGRGAQGVVHQIKDIEENLPFSILGFDCDNGSEFLNHHLVRYFTQRPQNPVQFTRSRPYQKNDNAFVEQKNWTHVRQLLGYDRLDNKEVLPLLNELYKTEWSLFNNFFCPCMKLKEKQRINSRYRKTYDSPQTPYQRIIASSDISDAAKTDLNQLYCSLNPFKLKAGIEEKLRRLFEVQRLPTI